jgi:Patatin-like phospholipase
MEPELEIDTGDDSVITVNKVLEKEFEQVETSRKLRLDKNDSRPAARNSLIGLAFSGGGIRSATFNLGILQALAQEKLLRAFDYVSTVSGGGYIGGWLMAWMRHQKIGVQTVEEQLSAPPEAPNHSADPPEVHFLRNYSNYLTPRKGVLGTDFWAFASGYLRNTMLNLAILVLALLSLLLMPRSLTCLVHLSFAESPYLALVVGLGLALLAVVFVGFNLVSVDLLRGDPNVTQFEPKARIERDRWFRRSWAVQVFIVVPLLLSAGFLSYGLGKFLAGKQIVDFPWYSGPILGCILYSALWAVALPVRGIVHTPLATRVDGSPKAWVILASAPFAGFITGFLFIPLARILAPAGSQFFDVWQTMTIGTPSMVGIMLIMGVLHIGLMGRGMVDSSREWWGRLGGLLIVYAACWLALFAIAFYFPSGLHDFLASHKKLTFSGVLVWVASTAYGVFFGKSDLSGLSILNATNRQKLWHYLARVSPYIFILGVLLCLSLLASILCAWITAETRYSPPSNWPSSPIVALACVSLLAAAIVLSWRVDINEFSSHYLYRNRLIRCYLGASVRGRNAQPFTGFSDNDNFGLAELRIPSNSDKPEDARPLPIVNTSLNVVRGRELAVQSRKARSFAFTPLYGGFTRQLPESNNWQSFFGPTEEAGCQRPAYPKGITLGTCIAVSGAAASPNMGSYSEPGLAFLMTLFDVRLGLWIGNPKETRKTLDRDTHWFMGKPTRVWWRRGSPGIGFFRLLCELLGNTNDHSRFLYLSDGGHFENLGIYELVRRRCKLIVACDASCDEQCALTDFHNAMERCRTDFGVTITLNDDSLLKPTGPQGALRSKRHFVKGTIHYPGVRAEQGRIIYIKSTLVDADPEDVLAYNNMNPHFPHDTTANQWFDESHFENYRALGKAAGMAAVDAINDAIKDLIGYDAVGTSRAKGAAA